MICLTFAHALQIFAKRIHGDAALCAVHKLPFRVEIETERQRACVGHVLRADGSDFRFGPVAIGGEADEMFVEQRGDGGLRDDALDEGAAIASSVAPVLHEDEFPFALRLCERIGQTRVPAHRAAIIKMRMRTFARLRHPCVLL
jgi:hypothetical protein